MRGSTHGLRRAALVSAILLIAVNLRPALASVGPLVDDIQNATGLSHAALGLLTTIPLLAFGFVSAWTPFVSRRLGMGNALAMGLALLCVGTALRSLPSIPVLFVGTGVLGIGIALGNVLLPALVKQDFPRHSGVMTSLYSSAMGLGATVAAGVSAPIGLRIGWRGALGIWAVPAALGLVAWWARSKRSSGPEANPGSSGTPLRSLGRSALAWQIALFMGLQSLTFYVILAWLPDILQSRGFTAIEAGGLLALSQATGVLGSAMVPLRAGRVDDQRTIVAALGLMEFVSLAGLILDDGGTLAWISILGFVLGGTFGLALLLLVLKSPNVETSTALSGMVQSVGYLLAAAGPAFFGLMYDLSAAWLVPMLFLMAVLVGKVGVGLAAAGPHRLSSQA